METKEKIVTEAITFITTRGTNAFSYKDISKEIGIKTSSIHYYFPTKNDLIVAVLEHVIQKNKEDRKRNNYSNMKSALRGYIDEHVLIREQNKVSVIAALAADINTLEPQIKAILTMTTKLPESIADQLSDTLSILENHLGETIQAVHLFGSAVDGGLKPFSDIDLLITVSTPLGESTRVALMSDLLLVSAFPGTDAKRRALEVTILAQKDVVPWRYPARRQMQFGEWLRHDINAGIFEPAMTDHDLAILLTKVRLHSLALYGPAAQEFFDEIPAIDVQRSLLETLALWTTEADWEGDERNIVLALVRIWYTAMTGDIASKDAAADWALQRLPSENKHIVIAARDGYLGLGTVDLAAYPQERAELLNYIRSSVTTKLQ